MLQVPVATARIEETKRGVSEIALELRRARSVLCLGAVPGSHPFDD
jgi:hypothetical protein